MGIVSIILLVLFVIACVLLVLVVLVQDEHGEGLGGLFSTGGTSFGPRQGNVLTRFTSLLGVIFLVGAFAVAWLNRTPEIGDVVRKARLEQLQGGVNEESWWVEQGQLDAAQPAGVEPAATEPAADDAAGETAPATP